MPLALIETASFCSGVQNKRYSELLRQFGFASGAGLSFKKIIKKRKSDFKSEHPESKI
jgi:hypothetical protein